MRPFTQKTKIISVAASIALCLLILGGSILTTPSVNAQAADVIGGGANLAEIPQQAKDSAENSVRTINSTKDTVSNDVLDALAISAARIAGEKLNNATYQWIAGGFKNGRQLFTASAREFLQEAGDEALRLGLTQLTTLTNNVTFRVQQGEARIDPQYLPTWIKEYMISAFQLEDETALEKLVIGAGMVEYPDVYCNGSILISQGTCGPDANQAWWDMQAPGSCQVGYGANVTSISFADACKAANVRWRVTVGLKTGQSLTFATSGWEANPDYAFPVDENGLKSANASAKPIETATFTTELSNAFGGALTKTAVATYNGTLSGTIQTTLKDVLGPLWLGFANDATIGYNKFDPYAGWDALLDAGNNALGTAFATANTVATEADRRLQAIVQESNASGFLPDKVCSDEGEIEFADGTVETICRLWDTKTPAATVGASAGEAVTQALSLGKDLDKWEQLGVTLLADATSAVITGGLQAARGEIQNRSQEVVAQIRQLGPFSYLYGELSENLTVGDDQSWQLLGSRDIDLSKINENINTTFQEAKLYAEGAVLLEQTAGPLLVLDQQCVFGPDFGWEQRLRNNFRDDVSRLDREVQMNSQGDKPKFKAQRQLRSALDDELARQVAYVEDAMASNPFKYQFEFQSLVRSAQPQVGQYESYTQDAADKQGVLSTLLQIRTLIERLGTDAAILTQTPPVWEDDVTEVFASGASDLGNLEISLDRLSLDALRDLDDSQVRDPQFSRPTISLSRTNVTVPHQDQDEPYLFDILQGVSVNDAEDSITDAGQLALEQQLIDNITITRVQTALDPQVSTVISPAAFTNAYDPDLGAEDTVQSGQVFIDISESYTVPEIPAVPSQPAVIAPNGVVTTPAVPGTPGRLEMQAGYRYIITYTVTDSDGNATSVTRNVKVKTYDQHLADLSAYNARLQNYVSSIPSAGPVVKSRLSQIVNLYLSIEKDISSETSVRNVEGSIQKIRQLQGNIYDSLDLCWLELWRLDKKVPEDLLPGNYPAIANHPFTIDDSEAALLGGSGEVVVTSNIDVFNDTFHGLNANEQTAWSGLQSRLATKFRKDSRIPYVDLKIPIERSSIDGLPDDVQDLEDTNANFLAKVGNIAKNGSDQVSGFLWDKLSQNGGINSILGSLIKPEIIQFAAPDFSCTTDFALLSALQEECNYNNSCIENVLRTYEDYHCISKLNTTEIYRADANWGTINRDIIRQISGTGSLLDPTPRATTPAYTPGRLTIGQYDYFQDDEFQGQNQFGPQRAIFPFADSISKNTISYLKIFPNWTQTPCTNNNNSFRRAVLGSTINCSDYMGTLVHTDPPVPEEVLADGLSINYWPLVQASRDIHEQDLHCPQGNCTDSTKVAEPSLARRFNYNYPYVLDNFTWDSGPGVGGAPNDPAIFPRDYDYPDTSITIYSLDVYKEHTEGRLYCRHRSILFQPVYNFNQMYDVANGDSWWTGEFDSNGDPDTKDIGDKDNWGDVQNCSDWTVSDLSTYLNYPKQEI